MSTLALPFAAEAAVQYLKWTTVTLPVSEGASCGNGTPARVMVNLTPKTTKTLVYFEGGGACWDQNACMGKGKLSEVASNPHDVHAGNKVMIYKDADAANPLTYYHRGYGNAKSPIKAVEVNQVADHHRLNVNPIQWLVALFEGFFL